MPTQPTLIIQFPSGGPLEQELRARPPSGGGAGEVVLISGTTDADGHLEPPDVGEIVLSVPSPEALARQAADVRRVIAGAGKGSAPLVVVVEVAELITEDELKALLDAARHSSRAVILRIMRDA